MSKIIIFIVVIVLFLVGGLFVWTTYFNKATAPTTSDSAPTKSAENAAAGGAAIPKEEVARHAEKESCWFIVEGKVYDFSPFLNAHPKLVFECGKDATADFASPPLLVGVEEMTAAREALSQFYIGDVAQ